MFYEKVISYCNKNRITVSGFEQRCGLSNGTVSKWKNGGSPSIPNLKKIAESTKVPVEKWLQ